MPSVEILISELKSYGLLNYQASLYAGFLGLSVGAAIAFGITLTTVTFTNPFTYAAYIALLTVSIGASILFAILQRNAAKIAKQEYERITAVETEEVQELEID